MNMNMSTMQSRICSAAAAHLWAKGRVVGLGEVSRVLLTNLFLSEYHEDSCQPPGRLRDFRALLIPKKVPQKNLTIMHFAVICTAIYYK